MHVQLTDFVVASLVVILALLFSAVAYWQRSRSDPSDQARSEQELGTQVTFGLERRHTYNWFQADVEHLKDSVNQSMPDMEVVSRETGQTATGRLGSRIELAPVSAELSGERASSSRVNMEPVDAGTGRLIGFIASLLEGSENVGRFDLTANGPFASFLNRISRAAEELNLQVTPEIEQAFEAQWNIRDQDAETQRRRLLASSDSTVSVKADFLITQIPDGENIDANLILTASLGSPLGPDETELSVIVTAPASQLRKTSGLRMGLKVRATCVGTALHDDSSVYITPWYCVRD